MTDGRYEQDSLYHLQCGDQPKVGTSTLACDEFAIQWHLRLGHASLKSTKSLFSSAKTISKLQCESHQFGKYHRTSFSFRIVNRCSSPLKLFILIFGVLFELKVYLIFLIL